MTPTPSDPASPSSPPAAPTPDPVAAADPAPAGGRSRRTRLLPDDPVLRRLGVVTVVSALGNGLFATLSALYFTQVVGLGVARVGLGLTVAGACGVAASIPAGRAADRWGSRPVLILLIAVEAAGMAAYALVRDFAVFLVLACLVTTCDRAASAARNALYADVLPKATRVRGRAWLRAVTNVAMGAGAASAALVLQADSRTAYVIAILFNAATFAAAALLLPGVPLLPGSSRARAARAEPVADGAGRRGALRDGPYLAITALNALFTVQFSVLAIGVPLWIVRDTHAPRSMAAAVMLVNTVLVAALQLRMSRGSSSPRGAARACLGAGLLLAGFCLVTGLAHGLPALLAAVVLVAGVVLQSFGEMLSQAGAWALSYDLADDRAPGAYQGVFFAGTAAASMAGPSLVAWTALREGLAGWALLAALFAVCGLAVPPVVRWAGRHRAVAAAGA